MARLVSGRALLSSVARELRHQGWEGCPWVGTALARYQGSIDGMMKAQELMPGGQS